MSSRLTSESRIYAEKAKDLNRQVSSNECQVYYSVLSFNHSECDVLAQNAQYLSCGEGRWTFYLNISFLVCYKCILVSSPSVQQSVDVSSHDIQYKQICVFNAFCCMSCFNSTVLLCPLLIQALIRKWAPVAIVLGVVFLLFWVKNKIW